MTKVTPESSTNTEEQVNAIETSNASTVTSHSSLSVEEQHNQEVSVTSLSHSQNEQNDIEDSTQDTTISIAELSNTLPSLETATEQEQIEEESQQAVEEEEEEEGGRGRGGEQERVSEGREAEISAEVVEQETEQQLQEHQQEQQIEQLLQEQTEQQNDTTSTNTSNSSTTNNSIYLQQQEEDMAAEDEEEEETRNTLPEIMTPSVPTVNNRVRSASTATPSTLNGLLPRSQRVWEMDRQASECRRCHRRFNFLVRRHHCRRCGQIVCDKCSSHRIRLPVEELIEDPMVSTAQYPLLATQTQRVCDTCYREPIRRSSESHSRRSHRTYPMNVGHQMRRTDSSQSLMIDCPVCGHSFLGMQKHEQEEHLQRCLNVGSPPVQSPRYIVYQLSTDSTQIGDECPICFDEFNPGDKVSRMICLCSYHQHCLSSWLQRGKGCPVHYDSLHI